VLGARLVAAWDAWLFTHGELRTLAVFRIGWAVAMLAATRQEAQMATIYGPERYHAPLFGWAVPLEAHAFHTLIAVAFAGCFMTLIGLLPQLGASCVVACHGYLFASDLLLFRNHLYLGLLLGTLLALSPCGRALAADALIRKRFARSGDSSGSRAAVQVIKAQILIVYAWSVINKLRGSFLDGWALQAELPYALHQSLVASWLYGARGELRPAVASFIANDRAMAICSCAVVICEAFLLFGLPQRRWRSAAMVVGIGFHGVTIVFMNVVTFGLLMLSTYPLFTEPTRRRGGPTRPSLTAALPTRATEHGRLAVPRRWQFGTKIAHAHWARCS